MLGRGLLCTSEGVTMCWDILVAGSVSVVGYGPSVPVSLVWSDAGMDVPDGDH